MLPLLERIGAPFFDVCLPVGPCGCAFACCEDMLSDWILYAYALDTL